MQADAPDAPSSSPSSPAPSPEAPRNPAADPAPEVTGNQGPAFTPAAPLRASRHWGPWLAVALVAVALLGWQWAETRHKLHQAQAELAQRVEAADSASKETRGLAKQSQDEVAQLEAKMGALQAKQDEFQSQQASLANLYQDMVRNRDEWTLAEIEQSLTLAAQQLQLAGNVPGAILALQAADTRLARSAQPQFLGLRQVLNRDLARLRAAPLADLPGMSVRLETVLGNVDRLPLAFEARPRQAREAAGAPAPTWWQRLGTGLWDELKGLVRVQRLDRSEPALLAPAQSAYLRENLKLRLLNARLAMLSRDQWTFRSELKQSEAWLERYFNTQDPGVANALSTVRQLAGTDLMINLPDLNDSLGAVRNLKLGKEAGK